MEAFPTFSSLPAEMTAEIFGYIDDSRSLSHMRAVSRAWREFADADNLWLPLLRREPGLALSPYADRARERLVAARTWTHWNPVESTSTEAAVEHLEIANSSVHYALRGGNAVLRQSLDGTQQSQEQVAQQPVSCLSASREGILVGSPQTAIMHVSEDGAQAVSAPLRHVKALDSTDGQVLSAQYNGALQVHDIIQGEETRSIDSGMRRLSAVSLEGPVFVCGNAAGHAQIALYDLRSPEPASSVPYNSDSPIQGLRLIGDEVLSLHSDATLRLWDVRKQATVLQAASSGCGLHCYDVYSRFLYTGHSDGTVRTWDRHSLELVQEQQICQSPILSLKRSGDSLFTGSRDAKLKRSLSTERVHYGKA